MKQFTKETFWQKVHRLKKRGYNEKDAIEKAKEKIKKINYEGYQKVQEEKLKGGDNKNGIIF